MPEAESPSLRSPIVRTMAKRGPKFFRDGSDATRIMFVFHYDGSTRDGPREATEADAAEHEKAYADFLAEDERLQSGQPGPKGKPLDPTPFRPLVSFEDPPGGRPAREIGAYERRRNEAYEKGERA